MRDTIQGRIIEDIITRPDAKNISPRMKKLIQGLLTVRHDKRWGFTEVSRWLAGEDVPVFENAPLRDFDPLKFGNRTLNSMEEVVAALDSDRELAKKILMRAELEKWAARSGFDRLSDEITAIRESDINDDLKVSTLLYLLEPSLPCRINDKTKLKKINDFIDILRREPEAMGNLILEEKKSDLYPWLDTIDKDIAPLIREQVANYKREGDNAKRLSVISNVYLSFALDKIKPFADNDYEMSGVNDLINIPKGFRGKVLNELINRNSILYIWLRRQEIPDSFEMDWGSMDKTWNNLMEILSGNVEYIRERKIKEVLRITGKLRRFVVAAGAASLVSIAVSFCLLMGLMFSLYSFPGFSSNARIPVPQKWSNIYEIETVSSKRTLVNGNLVLIEPALSKSDISKLKDQDMINVKYYSGGKGTTGFMRKKDLNITYFSYNHLFFFIPALMLCIFSLAGVAAIFIKSNPYNFYYDYKPVVTAAGVISTAGISALFMVPLFIYYEKWVEEKIKSDKAVSFIKSGKFTAAGGEVKTENYKNYKKTEYQK